MGLFDRFRDGLGVQRPVPDAAATDDQAIARYRYLLRTAPPETIEQAHAEAFAQLTPEQRRRVLQELVEAIPPGERGAAMRGGDSPEQLARVATRAELRQPGMMERLFGTPGAAYGGGGAPGMGGMFAGSFLSSMAGSVLGSMIAQHFFSSHPAGAGLFDDPGHAGDPPGFWPAEHGRKDVDQGAGLVNGDDFSIGADDADLGDVFDSGTDGDSWDT